MKKKTLIILLIIPFLIGLLTFVSVVVLQNTVAGDCEILWNYAEVEGFKLDNSRYELKAERKIDPDIILADGNELTWKIKDIGDDTDIARIENVNDKFYFVPLNEGECEVICSNVRGTKQKSFKAIVYNNGTIIINPHLKNSGENIDSNKYFGQYDFKYDSLTKDGYSKAIPSVSFDFKVLSDETNSNDILLVDKSSNLNFNHENNSVSIIGSGDAYFKVRSKTVDYLTQTYKFKIIEDAFNVYSYNDLLMATNFSSDGEKAVLQVNLESLKNTFETNDAGTFINEYLKENTRLFGNYDFSTRSFNFENELYTFETTYNKTYIDEYNEANKNTSGYQKFEPLIKAGLRVRKDIYGNGFTVNLHNLAYPNNGIVSSTTKKLTPTPNKDYFFGPLPLITIGSINEGSIVKAFAEDNVGMYLDADNILVNDLKLKNTNDINNLYDLYYTGTVLESNGNNNVIKNSVLSHGKNIIRAFSNDNLLIDNCIIHTSNEFNCKFGSNKINYPDETQRINYTYNGSTIDDTFNHFFNAKMSEVAENEIVADSILTYSLMGESGSIDFEILKAMQEYLDNTKGIINSDGSINYDGNIVIKDTSFYNSGIFSIAFESSFNGPYLYNGYPSQIGSLLSSFNVVAPYKVGGTSYPVKLKLSGDTRFYDYKDVESIDASCLIEENISSALNRPEISIDDFFPMKKVLKKECTKLGYIYKSNDKEYINTPIAYYGGGLNLSSVEYDINVPKNTFSSEMVVNIAKMTFDNEIGGDLGRFLDILAKYVSLATGFNPFKFITNDVEEHPNLFNKTPSLDDFKDRAKEA